MVVVSATDTKSLTSEAGSRISLVLLLAFYFTSHLYLDFILRTHGGSGSW
jgi:hypothetical protein